MGGSYFFIPGHSGTEFKHRKAFTEASEIRRKTSRSSLGYNKEKFGEPRNDSRTSVHYPKRSTVYYLRICLYWIICMLFVIFLIRWIDNYPIKSNPSMLDKDLAFSFSPVMISRAEYQHALDLYSNEEYDAAYQSFRLCLGVMPKDKLSVIGMTICMSRLCVSGENQYCPYTKDFAKYLYKANYLNTVEYEQIILGKNLDIIMKELVSEQLPL